MGHKCVQKDLIVHNSNVSVVKMISYFTLSILGLRTIRGKNRKMHK